MPGEYGLLTVAKIDNSWSIMQPGFMTKNRESLAAPPGLGYMSDTGSGGWLPAAPVAT
jgi:hypothetical protein